ncbi:Down syndrome cell adhesion molecule-like protein Dscam2 [Leptotrombidium deliense]|uniref:Down syndrome cell adhesion molecule-like protein Dscam2 n=1 Tax=Leptotrombidium deliense TaxID=299467 RepID=A0A443SK30_9ACAR|nr:Down syndrome cell adhesion molecule-like protein Dscam2 [Leptotrombidium deliense]
MNEFVRNGAKGDTFKTYTEPPTFLERFSEQTLQQGPPLSLKCIASGSPLPQVTWLLDGFAVPDNSRFRTGDYVTRDGLLVSYVNITSVTTQDGGLYECTASNDNAAVKHSAKINIFGAPFVRPMKNASTVAGETLVIHCPAGGYPLEAVYWEKGKFVYFAINVSLKNIAYRSKNTNNSSSALKH